LAVLLIFSFIFRVVGVDGESMCDTLGHNDRLILISEFYQAQRGDIVVIRRSGEEPYIKRVIAVAGDTVDIDDATGRVFLNGAALDEPYVRGDWTPSMGFVGPYTIGDGEFFAMGDNRTFSKDSRQLGVFLTEDIIGEAVMRIFPLDSIGLIRNEE
jgi:signal peptidase I